MQPTFHLAWHRAALAGESDAIARLAVEAIEPLYRFCFYRVGGNCHLCEEIVQETLVRAIRDLDRYDPDRAAANIFPWLTGLARNEIRRVLAEERNATTLGAFWERIDVELRQIYGRLESDPLDEEVLRREETRGMVGATMSHLPSHYREALEEKYVAGRSVRDMATAWSITEKAVESRLTRARNAFRATFLALARNLSPEPQHPEGLP